MLKEIFKKKFQRATFEFELKISILGTFFWIYQNNAHMMTAYSLKIAYTSNGEADKQLCTSNGWDVGAEKFQNIAAFAMLV